MVLRRQVFLWLPLNLREIKRGLFRNELCKWGQKATVFIGPCHRSQVFGKKGAL